MGGRGEYMRGNGGGRAAGQVYSFLASCRLNSIIYPSLLLLALRIIAIYRI